MKLHNHNRLHAVTVLVGIAISFCSASALAKIDTFRLVHRGGPCGDAHFVTNHLIWANRSRIAIATNETIGVVMYGHGAENADDATGSDIFEWIDGSGTTVDYPGVPIMFGQKVPTGFVTVAIRSEPKHDLGDHTVTVRWSTGNETIPIKVVASCQDLANSPHRTTVPPGTGIVRPIGAPQPKTCKDGVGQACN